MRTRAAAFAFFWLLLSLPWACSTTRDFSSTGSFRVMTYNIHHGEGTDSTVDLRRIASLIRESGADIVALQEVDRGVERTKKIDIMTELSDLTGMAYAFGKNIDYQGGDYGNGFLTRFPILEERNHWYTMLRSGEQRGLLQLVVEIGGVEVAVMNTHLDYRPDDTERLANVDEILSIARRFSPRPTVLCGDFNDLPESRTMASLRRMFEDTWLLAGNGDGFTYPSVAPIKRIDYVLVSQRGDTIASLRPIAARVMHSPASDHLPVVVEFELPRQQ